jgi:ribosomal-protein-alanine N-acetyltransferase
MMMSVEFREMNEDDLDAVVRLERECFAAPWSRQMFREELDHRPKTYFFVAGDATDSLLAYGGAWFVADECHIVNIAVRPDQRRRKLGARCLLHLIDEALARGMKRFTLEVRANNEAALRLYERFGFTAVALRKQYYREEKQDAVIMWIHDATAAGPEARLQALREELMTAPCS